MTANRDQALYAEMSIQSSYGRELFNSLIIEDTPVEVKVSAGYAIYPEEGVRIDELVSSADGHMYYEKRRKRILENPVRRQISVEEAGASSGGDRPSGGEIAGGDVGGADLKEAT